MSWYLLAWKQYAVFSGRAQRAAYWYFLLFNLIFTGVAGILDGVLGTYSITGTGILGTLYSLAAIVPSIAVGVRRLHDTGRSGWLLLLGFIPLVGWVFLLIWFVQDSDPGPNAYGPSPKGMPAAPA